MMKNKSGTNNSFKKKLCNEREEVFKMNKYYFNKIYGAIYERNELKQSLLYATGNEDIDVDEYIQNQQRDGILVLIEEGYYVFMSNHPAYNSYIVYHPDLASNQLISRYSKWYPKGTKITMYDYQKNRTEWVV